MMLTVLLSLLLTLVLWLGALGLGRTLGTALFGDEDRALVGLSSPVVGLALIALISLLILVLGGLSPAFHWIGPLAGWYLAWQRRQEIRGDWHAMKGELGDFSHVVLMLVVAVGAFLLIFAVGPVVDWDSLTFHDRVMQQFVDARRLFVPEDNLHVAQLGIAQLSTTPLRTAGIVNPGALMSVGATLLAILAAAVAASRLTGASGALLAGASIAGTPLLLLVGMTPRVDAFLALATLLAMLALSGDFNEKAARRIGWAILLIAIMAATKFHGMALAALMAPFVVWNWRTAMTRQWVSAVIVGTVVLGPWLLLNQIHFGAPLYPFFAQPRLEPWLAQVIGSTVLPQNYDPTGLDLMSGVRATFNPWHFMFSPQRLTLESEGGWYRPSLLLLLFPLAGFLRPRRNVMLWVGIPLAYLAMLLAVAPATSPRYLLPAIIPLSIAVAAGTLSLLQRRTAGSPIVLFALVILALGQSLAFVPAWLTPGVVRHAVGLAPSSVFTDEHPDITVRRFAGVPAMIDSAVPGTGVVLMLFEARGGGVDHRVIADSRAAFWPVLAQSPAIQDCLEDSGVTHVLLNAGALDYYLARGASSAALQVDRLRDFLGRCASGISAQDGFVLLQLHSADAGIGATP